MNFDIDKYAYVFETEQNKAYFWHGRTYTELGIYNSRTTATQLAEENGGKTIEMCLVEHKEELEKAGVTFKPIRDWHRNIIDYEMQCDDPVFWDKCSKSFTEQASGEIHVAEGKSPRDNEGITRWIKPKIAEEDYKHSCWARIERPILTAKSNEKVHTMTSYDLVTSEKTPIFERQINNNNAQRPDRSRPSREPPDRMLPDRERPSREPPSREQGIGLDLTHDI